MSINWIIIALVLLFALALIIFLVRDNLKDKKEVEDILNADTEIKSKPDLKEDD